MGFEEHGYYLASARVRCTRMATFLIAHPMAKCRLVPNNGSRLDIYLGGHSATELDLTTILIRNPSTKKVQSINRQMGSDPSNAKSSPAADASRPQNLENMSRQIGISAVQRRQSITRNHRSSIEALS